MADPQDRPRPAWRALVLTLFPELFPGPLGASLAGRALERRQWRLETLNFRDYAQDRHGRVDDEPFGGGPGMILRADVVDWAMHAAVARAAPAAAASAGSPDAARRVPSDRAGHRPVDRPLPILYLSPRGRPLDQAYVRNLAAGPGAILVCGRYEGLDQRVIDAWRMDEVSVGDYVLSGGEIAAMAVLDSVVRVLPGVVGAAESLAEESFEAGLLEYPQFTRPEIWTDDDGVRRTVPEVLMSGHHRAIADWRRRMAEETTKSRRPDLWSRYAKNKRGGDTDEGSGS